MSQAEAARPLRGRAYPSQRGEDVSGASGLNTSLQGVSEPKVARMSQVKVAGPSWGMALPRSELRG